MRTLLVIPLALLLAALAAGGILHAMHWPIHWRDVLLAAGVCAVSGLSAQALAASKRHAGITVLFQFGLLATVIHLLGTLILGAIVFLAGVPVDRKIFLYLILIFYWVSLTVLARMLVRYFREETVAAGPQRPN